jgi:hypothetical protein
MTAARYLVLSLLLTATALSCGAGQDPCQVVGCRADAGPAIEDASATEAGPDGGTVDPLPAGCDTPNEPVKNPEKCLVDSFGAFVSPTGDDGNAGTKAKPFKTIGKALTAGRDRVVVCEGEYGGSLDITKGVSIFGGVTCDFAKAGGRPKIVATQPAYAIKIAKVTDPVLLSDVEVIGKAGAKESESSIGIFVSESASVQFARMKVEAQDGVDAAPKKDGAFTLAANAPKGGDASGNTGGASATTGACPGGGSSSGGKGGDIGFQGDDGSPKPPGGAKGIVAACNAGGGGSDGETGGVGSAKPGAAQVAALSASGIVGGKGGDGANGTPGGGGGGGYGTAGAGGAGGAGGCGGQGGVGGGPGGSSLAIVSFSSALTLQAVELVAKAAKPGGAGGAGQVGQPGGFSGNKSGGACAGGNGAKGGDGGAGGGGAGGIAAGIAWAGGIEPKRDAQTKISRPAGPGPSGGEGGAASNKGADGVHADVYEVK